MARGTIVAQMRKRGPKVSIPYRADPAQVEELDRVQKAEGGDAAVSRSEVVEHLVDKGLALYWAVEALGADRFMALVGGDERGLIREIVRRGVEALEAEHGRKRGR